MKLNLVRTFVRIGALAASLSILWMTSSAVAQESVEQWDVHELTLHGPAEGNPYLDVTLDAEFTNGSKTVKVPGFYDGKGIYKIRFSPEEEGTWNYVTKSNREGLTGKSGSLECVAATGNNHGPVRIVNTHYLQYADGSPAYLVGTTAYQWACVKQSIQDKTVETLANSPFNKIRMCFFPKSYRYGNDTEPWAYPYESKTDFEHPNFEYFQSFDKRVRQLRDLGVQADLILFHPYDRWGYLTMGRENAARYVRYLIARLSAYRNVWWSLANEWDIPRIKSEIDWEGIGTLLQNEDPHQRMRGIHNWYYGEHHFYDHSRPWVTHVSAQTYFFFNAIGWRNKYDKPLLIDEMRYEGDVSSSWGNLTAKEMTSYFWMAGLSGTYGTHGDTFKNDSDDETEVRWWAKGGTLPGKSPERIAYFRKIMERAPVAEMTPRLVRLSSRAIPEDIPDRIDRKIIAELNNNIYVLSKAGEQYLAYTQDAERTIELDLAGDKQYRLEVIDTWNMKVLDEKIVPAGKFQLKTEEPYTAVRLVAQPDAASTHSKHEAQARETYVKELGRGVYFRKAQTKPEFTGCNQGWIVFKDFVLVIDANFPGQVDKVIEQIKETTDKPIKYVFDTHHHGDHADGNAVYAKYGIQSLASSRSKPLFETKGLQGFEASKKNRAAEYGGLDYSIPNMFFDRKLVLDDGEQRVELLYIGHGHTEGDAVAWLPRLGIMFTGDACVNGAFNYTGDSNTESWISVLNALEELPIKTLAPGHGEPGGKELIANQRRYFVELREQVKKGIDAGSTVDEIKANIELPFYKEWTGDDIKTREENIEHVYNELVPLRKK